MNDKMSINKLPIIIVSAADKLTASQIISKIVDNQVCEDENEEFLEDSVIWRLENKYYTADVRVWPLADGDTGPPDDLIEARVIYLTEEECAGPDGGAALAAARARPVALALLLAAAPRAPLQRWAAAAGLGAALPAAAAAEARAALHAHVWPGLRRREEAGGGGAGVERAESFAAALGALGPAAAAARGLRGAARLDAAERLVAAFCRALDCDVDDC